MYTYSKEMRWMVSLGIGLLLAMLVWCIEVGAQKAFSDKLLRLHVVAHSDESDDQAVKLRVRDAVLACQVSRRPTPEEMRRVQEAAENCLALHGFEEKVRVSYRRMYFETRMYENFALPAGYYHALRVVIGDGQGQNWWCVAYPALCTDLARAEGELTEAEIAMIRQEGKRFVVRFKVYEMISAFHRGFFKGE